MLASYNKKLKNYLKDPINFLKFFRCKYLVYNYNYTERT